jgi:hypothetical protein
MAGTTTNYAWTYPTSTDLVKDGATAIQTAIQGADTTLFTALGGAYPGLRQIKKQTIGTSVSSVTVTGAFSSTYEAYKIVLANVTMSSTVATTALLCKMHDGTNPANSNYQMGLARMDIAAGTVGGSTIQNGTAGVVVGRATGDKFGGTFELVNPFTATHTVFTDLSAVNVSTGYMYKGAGMHQTSTSYSGFQIIVDAGTLTGGTIYVYGYGTS